MAKPAFVYILASRRNGTLYVGVTTDPAKRIWDHRHDLSEGFTQKYGVHQLVYIEAYHDILSAISREKQIKRWRRAWKLDLIESMNPGWKDLYPELF